LRKKAQDPLPYYQSDKPGAGKGLKIPGMKNLPVRERSSFGFNGGGKSVVEIYLSVVKVVTLLKRGDARRFPSTMAIRLRPLSETY
jgi:hypothetical protein